MAVIAVSKEQYSDIIQNLFKGVKGNSDQKGCRPNSSIATALQIEANTGLRIGDVLKLRRGDIIYENDRYRFDIKESKTKKPRTFFVPVPVVELIEDYCEINNVNQGERIFNIGERQVQKILKIICDHLGYTKLSTHSFRKYFATKAYNESNHDIELVRRLLQHSSAAITARYIGITDERTENVLNACVDIM